MRSFSLYYQSACRGPASLDRKQLQGRKRGACQFCRSGGAARGCFYKLAVAVPRWRPVPGLTRNLHVRILMRTQLPMKCTPER
jgi:hypothetical protein